MSVTTKAVLMAPAKTRTLAIIEGPGALSARLRPAIDGAAATSQQAANMMALLLSPLTVLAYVFAAWRLGADMDVAGEFPIPTGLFSHWLVWVAIGAGLQTTASFWRRPAKAAAGTDLNTNPK
jgi:hypothetical protein